MTARMKRAERARCCLIGVGEAELFQSAFDFYAAHLHRVGNRVVIVHVVEPRVRSSMTLRVQLDSAREQTALEEKQRVKRLQELYEDKMRVQGVSHFCDLTLIRKYAI